MPDQRTTDSPFRNPGVPIDFSEVSIMKADGEIVVIDAENKVE